MGEQICPDAQSPELSVPCPTFFDTMPDRVGQGGQLPYTGLELWVILLVAVGVVLFAWWLIQGMQEDDE